jgi:periplasmic protein TonB
MTISYFKMTALCLILGLINQKAIGQIGLMPHHDSLIIIEKHAEFPNGREAMFKFIKENMRFPMPELEIQGTVYVNFCVEADGTLTDIKVRRGIMKLHDEEAIRLVSIMPKWTPAVEFGTGKNIRNYFTVPIRFRLE